MNTKETQNLKTFVRCQGIDLVGIADLHRLENMPIGIPVASVDFLNSFRCTVVLSAQLNKLGNKATGSDVSLLMEKAAIDVLAHLEGKGYPGLIIHIEDEFDPRRCMGLLALKVLAKAARLGWQGRSLLIINPEYGPVHRWIAVQTGMDLQAYEPPPNHYGDCSLRLDKCPKGALTLVSFADHPENRSDVLNIETCLGEKGYMVCLAVCLWAKTGNTHEWRYIHEQ